MISIVLLIMECGVLSIVLIFEDFSENSLSISCLTVGMFNSLAISLDTHASSMNSIKLILDVCGSSW